MNAATAVSGRLVLGFRSKKNPRGYTLAVGSAFIMQVNWPVVLGFVVGFCGVGISKVLME